jgi:small-conductance mechanosensitive channel
LDWLNQMLLDFGTYITNEELWISLLQRFLKIVAIIVISIIVIRLGRSMIKRIFEMRLKSPLRFSERRETTLVKLIDNVVTYVISFIAVLMILSEFDIDIAALIAGAGVVGLAIGFGAQNLVRDIITGFFIIFESQFSVGDFVRTGNFEGTVEEIGLRTTKIKSWTGELHILPNSSITEVTNFSINNSIAVVDVSIAYEENVDEAEAIIRELLEEVEGEKPEVVKTPEILGIQMLGGSEVVIRITAEVLPMQHWAIGRYLRKIIKQRLEERHIEIPYPRLVMYQREEEQQKGQKSVESE